MKKIEPYLPHYCRAPNKLLGYYDQLALRKGNVFKERVAVYLNKKNERCEEICMVRRDETVAYPELAHKPDQTIKITSVQ